LKWKRRLRCQPVTSSSRPGLANCMMRLLALTQEHSRCFWAVLTERTGLWKRKSRRSTRELWVPSIWELRLWEGDRFAAVPREEIKQQVRSGQLRLVIGTDAASEGLNLQRLATLINPDLPWNPTRLEQRKGRIQRIGQLADTARVAFSD